MITFNKLLGMNCWTQHGHYMPIMITRLAGASLYVSDAPPSQPTAMVLERLPSITYTSEQDTDHDPRVHTPHLPRQTLNCVHRGRQFTPGPRAPHVISQGLGYKGRTH